MRSFLTLLLAVFSFSLMAQDIEGSWKLISLNGKAVNDKEYVRIYQDGYFAFGGKELKGDRFLDAGGGTYEIKGDRYAETLDFYTSDPQRIGKTIEYKIKATSNEIRIEESVAGEKKVAVWQKISDKKDDLAHNWVITARANSEGVVNEIVPGDRRTVKILGGGRFQWIAFNSKTGEFSGTGGGTYTAKDGKYVEHITFFSRDDNRVGAQLEFNYAIVDGKWHHTGKSSTGNPINETWSKYKEAYKPAQ